MNEELQEKLINKLLLKQKDNDLIWAKGIYFHDIDVEFYKTKLTDYLDFAFAYTLNEKGKRCFKCSILRWNYNYYTFIITKDNNDLFDKLFRLYWGIDHISCTSDYDVKDLIEEYLKK